jgi:hypothetical protein
MECNYPESFDKFWDGLNNKKIATKTKNGIKYTFKIDERGFLDMNVDGEQDWIHLNNDKESFYCEMLDWYLFPRVKEHV